MKVSKNRALTIFQATSRLEIPAFFISNTFISNTKLKLAKKIKQKLSNILRLNYWRTCPKNKFVFFNETIWMFVMKMKTIIEK